MMGSKAIVCSKFKLVVQLLPITSTFARYGKNKKWISVGSGLI